MKEALTWQYLILEEGDVGRWGGATRESLESSQQDSPSQIYPSTIHLTGFMDGQDF